MTAIKKIDSQTVVKAAVAAVISVALFAGAFMMPASSASAQTNTSNMSTSELQALINQLMAQLQALQNGTSTLGVCPYVWTRDLGQGSTGPDVMRLQQFLNTQADTQLAVGGAGAPGMETQYYGPITAAAVSKFQAKYRTEVLLPIGLVNPTGYFGAMSRAKANSLCSTVTNPSDNGGGTSNNDDVLHGGAGYLSNVELSNDITNEDVGEGQEDVDVLGLNMDAEGSDVELSAVTIDFDQVSADANFNHYADEVSIYLDGEEVGRVDADEFTRNNGYRQTITLDRGAIIREGDTGELVVAVSGINNLDSDQEGDQWSVAVDSVRFRDAQGAVISDTQMNNLDRTITFQEFASATGLEVRVRSGDSDINTAHTVEVSSSDSTRNIDALSFKVEVRGDSDINVDEMTFNATTTGATLSKVLFGATLLMDGDRVGTESINTDADTITFDNLDLDLRAGKTYDFTVQVNANRANGTNYSSGATVDIDLSNDNLDDWYIEDENGDTVSASDRSGAASSDAITLRTEGASLALVSSNTREVYNSTTPSASYGEYRMTIEVRAIGGPVYIPESAARSTTASTSAGAAYYFEDSSGNAYTGGTSTDSFSRISGGTFENGYVRIDEGETARFELVATLDPGAAGQYRAQLVSIGFNDTATAPDSTISATPAADFRSGLQVISN